MPHPLGSETGSGREPFDSGPISRWAQSKPLSTVSYASALASAPEPGHSGATRFHHSIRRAPSSFPGTDRCLDT